jgi:hypothetical protein
MGLDSASGSAAETQKLNFEEQSDSRVRANGRGSDSCSHPSFPLEHSFSPLQKSRDWEVERPGFCLKTEPVSLGSWSSLPPPVGWMSDNCERLAHAG